MMIEFWDFEFAECQYGNLKLVPQTVNNNVVSIIKVGKTCL